MIINTNMKIHELLQETPLPDDWNKEAFDLKKSDFDSRLAYALERAPFVGRGSSRVATEIQYEGRDTILKIAVEYRGIMQNIFEAKMLGDPNVVKLNITIPMIDYDVDNKAPTWIHTEYAEPMEKEDFIDFFGFIPDEVIAAVKLATGSLDAKNEYDEAYLEIFGNMIRTNKYVQSLIELRKMYPAISFNDLGTTHNWGVYKNKPVIIDLGASKGIITKHYGGLVSDYNGEPSENK